MLALLKNKVDYPLRHVLGFDVKPDTAGALHRLAEGRELVLLSRLMPAAGKALALLELHPGDSDASRTEAITDLLKEAGYTGSLSSTPVYPINQALKTTLQSKALASLDPGYLFLNHKKIRLSREDVDELIFEFQLQALKPVLLFPETNPLFVKTPKLLSGLEHRGTLFLLDWRSLTGEQGHLAYKIACHLLENKSAMGIGFRSNGFKDLGKTPKINRSLQRLLTSFQGKN